MDTTRIQLGQFPVLVISQFALLAAVPVAFIVFGAFKDMGVRALRWWAAALGTLYASPGFVPGGAGL